MPRPKGAGSRPLSKRRAKELLAQIPPKRRARILGLIADRLEEVLDECKFIDALDKSEALLNSARTFEVIAAAAQKQYAEDLVVMAMFKATCDNRRSYHDADAHRHHARKAQYESERSRLEVERLRLELSRQERSDENSVNLDEVLGPARAAGELNSADDEQGRES